jgi:TonB family protein
MPLIQIPLAPPPPPTTANRTQDPGDFYDARTWESAYREMHDFPTLLIQLQDDLARSRKREAFWISLFVHVVLMILMVNAPKFEKYLPKRQVMIVQTAKNNRPLTFLEAPPDTQKPVKRPDTDKISDKNRVAMSRQPQLDRDQLKKLIDAARKGRPGPTAPPVEQKPSPPQQAMSQPAPPQPEPAQQPQATPPPPMVAKLQTPPIVKKPTFSTESMSAGKTVEEAARAAAESKSRFPGDAGDLGLGQRQPTARMGPMEITTDTQGVDFGPYLQRVLHDVKAHWYEVIPPSAMPPLLKKGKLSIEFAITKNGEIAGLRLLTSSGDVALDRAAYGGIQASTPFPPLPSEFTGSYLGLRFAFYYNPDTSETNLR